MNAERIALEQLHDDERKKAMDQPPRIATVEALEELRSIGSLAEFVAMAEIQEAMDTGSGRAPSCSVGPRPWSEAKTAERPPETPKAVVEAVQLPRLGVTDRVHARRAVIWPMLGTEPKTTAAIFKEVGEDYIAHCCGDAISRMMDDLGEMRVLGLVKSLGRVRGWVLVTGSEGAAAG